MLLILNVTAPFFALVLCGYLAARWGALPEKAVPALNTFVLYFALPCMMFRFAAARPIGAIVNPPVFLAYGLTGVTVLAIVATTLRFAARESVRDSVFAALASAWSNWGYMGIAMMPPLLGEAALAPLIGAGMADLLLVVSLALVLASRDREAAGGVRVLAALRPIARNPLVWAVGAGGICSALQLGMPAPVDQFTLLLGQAAGPVALFTIGVSLYRPATRTWRRDVVWITGAKLLLHPALVGLVAIFVFRLAPLEVRTLVLGAALPVAGTVFVFAEQQGANAERIAASILVSTALAFLTFSGLCWTLGLQAVR